MKKILLALILIINSPCAQAQWGETKSLFFGATESKTENWKSDIVVSYADEILVLESQTLTLPAKILQPNLASEILVPGEEIRFIQENNTIVKLNLTETTLTQELQAENYLGTVVAVLALLAILGLWRRFYQRAKS